jgi:ATP-dependent Clp protease ATP-binding subunit ClpA
MDTEDLQTDRLLASAMEQARRLRHARIRSEHLFLALLHDDDLARRCGVSLPMLADAVQRLPYPTCGAQQIPQLSETARRIAASLPAAADPAVMLRAIITGSPTVRNLLQHSGLDPAAVLRQLDDEQGER